MMGRSHLVVTAGAIAGIGYPAMEVGRRFAATTDVSGGVWPTVKTAGLGVLEAVGDGGGAVLAASGDLVGSLAYALIAHPLHLAGGEWTAMAGLAVAMTLLGSLLPDIDNPRSMAGRRIKLPAVWLGPHRSITHANWVPIALFAIGFFAQSVPVAGPYVGAACYATAVGYLGHLIADSFSHAGRAPWWPLGRWTLGPGGVVISQSRAVGQRWYAVGQPSEYVFVGAFTGLMLLMAIGLYA
jgi:hypothetical protein